MKKIIWVVAVVLLILILVTYYWLQLAKKNNDNVQQNQTTNQSLKQDLIEEKTLPPDSLGQASLLPAFGKEDQIFADDKIHNMEIIKLKDGRYRMFYHRGLQIKSAFSSNGKKFDLEEGIRLTGSMPATIELLDGKYRMYFADHQSKGVKSAISEDGLNFRVEEGFRLLPGEKGSLDEQGQVHLSVIRLPDNSYKMFFDGVASNPNDPDFPKWTIMSASSGGGLIWQKDLGGRIVAEDSQDENQSDDNMEEGDDQPFINMAWSSHIQYKDGIYILYFGTQWVPLSKSGIYRATSKDGINFSNIEPILLRDLQYGDKMDEIEGGPRGVPQDPFILETDQGERLFYWLNTEGIFSAVEVKP